MSAPPRYLLVFITEKLIYNGLVRKRKCIGSYDCKVPGLVIAGNRKHLVWGTGIRSAGLTSLFLGSASFILAPFPDRFTHGSGRKVAAVSTLYCIRLTFSRKWCFSSFQIKWKSGCLLTCMGQGLITKANSMSLVWDILTGTGLGHTWLIGISSSLSHMEEW